MVLLFLFLSYLHHPAFLPPRYIERTVEIEKAILNLMEFAISNEDLASTMISEQNLEAYLFRLIPEVDRGERLHESFYEFYTYTCSQKFLFFLDSRRTNSISIKKVRHLHAGL